MLKVFTIFAVITLAATSYAMWQGIWVTPTQTVHNVPKNVRSNPGTWRSHYTSVHVYGAHGGK